jgi:excisionase family DNA binding protein
MKLPLETTPETIDVYEGKLLPCSHPPSGPNHPLQLLQQLSEQYLRTDGGFMNEYLSFNEIADDLGVPLRTVYFLNQQGKAPKAIKIGRTFRVAREDYESWKNENTQ